MSGYDPDFDFNPEARKLLLFMRALADLELGKIVATIEMAHTVGWAVDPTLYRDALQKGDMDAIGRLARALEPALKVWREEIEPKVPA